MTNSTEEYPESFKMVGSVKRALWVYAGPFTIGVVLTYIFVAMLKGTGHYLLLLWLIPLYVYVFWDLVLWLMRGVRAVEMDSTGLSITRAGNQSPVRINSNQITAVYVSRSLDRTTVNILLQGSRVTTFLSFRRYSGPRVRMTVEPFDRKEFSEFTRRVKNLRRTVQQQQSA
jgi:hypothetical protein